ncbi:hypothetical protein CAPTEDRAFT_172073 [Capitella teleta]|uniref:Alkaline phosphatase n=1 Tax=Capitella teleta TaxID=283909 RepID=R7TK77_CAPTE|nr:hypothetical protein CAPTEDRAFT_172073 [Capitella teleta]|eukprot:ELT91520.1 hypothetical protein CAPTEDRAFT_172073 [Capitella teleta]
MGPGTVTAARIHKGQLQGRPGEEGSLAFDRFPNVALSKTYNVDHQVTDSAATATAFLCGVKANYGTLGVGPKVKRGDCNAIKTESNITCFAELAQRAGKATGFVTTSRVTHATPAPLYARTADRMWEGDSELPEEAKEGGCVDIAAQLLGPVGSNLNVVMGGGRKFLLPNTEPDPEQSQSRGLREDGRNLVVEWMRDKETRRFQAKYAYDQSSFDSIEPSETDYMLGLFEYSHMKYESERSMEENGEPSLAEMVQKAIQVMQANEKGFFLLVEGARIDHAHHSSTARRALEEVLSMEKAVLAAMQQVNLDETLIVVTADHSHPLTISSYATRGNPILGEYVDFMPYTTLSYANGPGYRSSPRPNLTNVITDTYVYQQASAVPSRIVSHDGTDVGIYATGPMAHLFHSTHEQHYIYHVMSYASCLDVSGKHCQRLRDPAFYRSHSTLDAASINERTLLYGEVHAGAHKVQLWVALHSIIIILFILKL